MVIKMKKLISGKSIRNTNDAVIRFKKKWNNFSSDTALFSLLEDVRISKSELYALEQKIRSKSRIPLFKYK